MLNILVDIFSTSWRIFTESAIFMMFGFVAAGFLYTFIKPGKVARYLGNGTVRPVVISAFAGVPLPLCSCGVVPAAAGLKRQGANNGATLSFMISTPETGVDSIPITYALMDPVMTAVRPVAAFVTAVLAGIAENMFDRAGKQVPSVLTTRKSAECSSGTCCCPSPGPETPPIRPSIGRKVKEGLQYAFVDLLGDIGLWFIIGILLAGLISSLIPDIFFESFMNNDIIAMLVMLAAGIPMYVCATSSTPIAAALILKGLSPGAALVFLLSGPATNIAALTMITGILGKRALAIYLASISVCSVALGLATNALYSHLGISAKATAGEAAELFPHSIELTAAVLLAMLLIYALAHKRSKRNSGGCGCDTC